MHFIELLLKCEIGIILTKINFVKCYWVGIEDNEINELNNFNL